MAIHRIYQFDPHHGWDSPIPEPDWVRRWLLCWRPACSNCDKIFRRKSDWELHWIYNHMVVGVPETQLDDNYSR